MSVSRDATHNLEMEKVQPTGGHDLKDYLEGTHYKSMKWWHAALLAIADTVSIGILSLPSVVATIGLVPSVILIVGLGLITTYSGYVLIQLKLAFPGVHSMAEVGQLLAGRWGYEIIGSLQVIYLCFGAAAHLLTFTIALDRISGHATCTIVWSVVGLAVLIVSTLPRTLKNTSYIGLAALTSILCAIIVAMIDLGVVSSPQAVKATQPVTFIKAFAAVSDIVFAYSGHVTFFTIMSELQQPADFKKSLFALQTFAISVYVVVAVVVYVYAGDEVASPALLSLPPTVSRVAFGLALITIMGAGILDAHVAAKYFYVRIFRGSPQLSKRSFVSLGTWAGIVVVFWIAAWIIAESIPNFNTLLGLISSIFASWFSYGISGILWFYLDWHRGSPNSPRWQGGWRRSVLAIANLGLIGIGFALMALGLWSNGLALHDESSAGQSWSCGTKS